MQKEDDKVDNKTTDKKKEKKEKKRAREKDRNRFAKKAQILAMRMLEKQTKAVQ